MYTLPMCLAAFIRYREVVRALKLALGGNSGITILEIDQEANGHSLFRVLLEKIPDVELIVKGYYCFNYLKPHPSNWLYQPFCESLFWMSLDGYSLEDVFNITNVELGFIKILEFQGMDMKYKKQWSRTRTGFPNDLKELIVEEMKESQMQSKKEIEDKGFENHGGICAVCLNQIVLEETALVKGCEHAY
ncbi:hypothetical protein SO802_022507 [Lithocarpus litseifolius]|uniref:Uncharacterized protein n=1 Tax=Lithocarpus litseifolius TaxID=425828 RepID=A0AAW2C6N7_9ROSI